MNPRQAMQKKQEEKTKIYLPKNIELAVNLIHSFIKNNNIIGLKIAILLSGAKKQIEYDEDNMVAFNVNELCELINTDKRTLSRNGKKLLSTHFTYILQDGTAGETVPLHTFEYTPNKQFVKIGVSPRAKQLFTELGKGQYQFTKAVSDNLMELKHKHSLRMQLFLEMINNYSNSVAKRISMTLEDANEYFGVNYANWYEFDRKILRPVKEEITLSNKLTFIYSFSDEHSGVGRPKFTEVVIDVIDNSESLFAQT